MPGNLSNRSLIIAIVVALVIIFGLAAIWIFQPTLLPFLTKDKQDATLIDQTDELAPDSTFPPKISKPPLPDEPIQVRSYSGRVTAHNLETQTISLATIRGPKTVQYTDQTKLVFIDMPSPETQKNLSAAELRNRQDSELALINPGDIIVNSSITAASSVNIRQSESFIATKIILNK
jgi:hypothetical protein